MVTKEEIRQRRVTILIEMAEKEFNEKMPLKDGADEKFAKVLRDTYVNVFLQRLKDNANGDKMILDAVEDALLVMGI